MLLNPIISILLRYLITLAAIAFYTLIERKFLGYFQIRKGPNKPRIIGVAVPFADAIKLFTKEQTKPTISNRILFLAAPTLRLRLAIII
jgi:NADH-ubiquinone oxidoreductase chain 1